jgi:hypothetical protein
MASLDWEGGGVTNPNYDQGLKNWTGLKKPVGINFTKNRKNQKWSTFDFMDEIG